MIFGLYCYDQQYVKHSNEEQILPKDMENTYSRNDWFDVFC